MIEQNGRTETRVANENMVLTVGNSMMGDDGAGPLLAERMTQSPVAGWSVIDGGAIPENAAHSLRTLRPRRLLVVDATDMGLAPGEIRIVDPQRIAEDMLMNTHNLPLNFLIDQLKDDIPEVIFIGIQPALVAFYCPLSAAVEQAVALIHQRLAGWRGNGGFQML
ncbi:MULTISPECIES: hydrogenase maturation peptidase HycI [unclassified Brenneria]|uniref:hydrogenase maturation peptidase HycI n=1 Tax=unclassified Brenneria TaxID=2634434 RepID=UPI001556B9C6|nr:hydrogenase maturation peptidase HycI [Brenneria sp. hezel4-2-4]MEE3649852.1 hydrogenase maturation peptidase HycI [Brenneria sp. HEZEL_4_2_4]NPC99811.1 hydrogenase maturation peptidase HycI [Brenneria sp. hezel4-2-4]